MANSLNPAIAGLMGRGDLSRRGAVVQLDQRRVSSDAPGFGDGNSSASAYGIGGSGDVNTGRISIGMLGGMVAGAVAFYLYTKSHQA